MPTKPSYPLNYFFKDFTASVVVFLVALPLCLGIALASDAPLLSGLIAGIMGGIIVGAISGSHISVSGPAAGLTAVVATQIAAVGSFEAFLVAVVMAGVIQIILGLVKAGSISSYVPNSVIKGLLAAIGIILIMKQIPHLFGHDSDPEGEMSFKQPDGENTFSELLATIQNIHPGAALVGLFCLALLLVWDRSPLKRIPVPAALVVAILGGLFTILLRRIGGVWEIDASHLVALPALEDLSWATISSELFTFPDWSSLLAGSSVYMAGLTVAIVASLETVINLQAADKLDPKRRYSPPNRELIAQGCGNMGAGLLGGIPVTSVIIRSSVNASAGGQTKMSAVLHGFLIVISILFLADIINLIPLAALAAILLVTGFKLASPSLFKQMWSEGKPQLFPFLTTVLVIVFTDILTGIIVGLMAAIGFILFSNFRRPLRRTMETHAWGDMLRVELSNQVGFLNRPALQRTLNEIPKGGHVLVDATRTDYIDPDIVDYLHEFREKTAIARGVKLSLRGFKDHYSFDDQVEYVDYTSRELQAELTPQRVIKFLQCGNERFKRGNQLVRDFHRQIDKLSEAQHPMAAVLSCVDSRTPAEIIFDLGLGDVFNVRVAGNVARGSVLGSVEYACVVAGAKLVLVLGHTSDAAVQAAIDLYQNDLTAREATGCDHMEILIEYLQQSIDPKEHKKYAQASHEERRDFADRVARSNVVNTIKVIRNQSKALANLEDQGVIKIVGGMYDVKNGHVDFFELDAKSSEVRELTIDADVKVESSV